ncbi:MAG: hypothetical protein AAF899_08060 [Pseudomonadota bacterium]
MGVIVAVIPFDLARRGSHTTSAAQPSTPAAGRPRASGQGRSAAAALAMAEAKVASLERTLLRTLRENARNRLRAEKAEAALTRLGIDPAQLPHPEELR